jgi:tRNA-2-methylthio-N6-dimethylallyladenosine synthase
VSRVRVPHDHPQSGGQPGSSPGQWQTILYLDHRCQMNEADSAKVAATLQEVGYRRTEHEEDADIVVLNSCVVRQAAEDKVAGKLNSLIRLKRENPDVSVCSLGAW